jgi:DNA polymerase III alpha subunit (gram-positive type)
MKNSIFALILLSGIVQADIVFDFKNPSFSGVGTGAHYLTIENQEHSRKKAIEDALEAARKAAERDAENTTMAKFIRNLESRIYSQMSKQLVESMFSNDNAATFGSFTLEGNVVTYETLTQASGEDVIQLRIVDEYGTETVIEIPVGTGNFAQDPDTADIDFDLDEEWDV